MLKIHIRVDSHTLWRPVDVLIALPYGLLTEQTPRKNIWALHTAMKGPEMFFDDLSIANYIDKEYCAIIAPDMGNGFFMNTRVEDQADFLQKELFPLVCNTLSLSQKREDNVILGISAGALGAANWILSSPESFGSAALLSGYYDYTQKPDPKLHQFREQYAIHSLVCTKILPALFSKDELKDVTLTNLLSKKHAKNDQILSLALFCGTEDYISTMSTDLFYKTCCDAGLNATLTTSSGGHDMDYWLRIFPEVMAWLLR